MSIFIYLLTPSSFLQHYPTNIAFLLSLAHPPLITPSIHLSPYHSNAHVDMNHLRPKDDVSGKWEPGQLEFRGVTFRYSGQSMGAQDGKLVKPKVQELTNTSPAVRVQGTSVVQKFLQKRQDRSHQKSTSTGGLNSENSEGKKEKEKDSEDNNVWLHEDLLKNVSFTIHPGQNVAIVGPSGSGKSTVLKLITRMLDPTAGGVYIDGVNARAVSLSSLRERIAVVPQDTSLFDNTIEFNLKYGNKNASDADVQRVIKDTRLEGTLSKFKKGLQTSVGERGNRLSGGERQRVSIARALLKDPSIILCDEVTSAVDAFAEREITDALRLATNERSTVTVAHRLSSITHCDTIIVLEKGCVVQQGSHKQLLLDKEGTYSKMWLTQQGVDVSVPAESESEIKEIGNAT